MRSFFFNKKKVNKQYSYATHIDKNIAWLNVYKYLIQVEVEARDKAWVWSLCVKKRNSCHNNGKNVEAKKLDE